VLDLNIRAFTPSDLEGVVRLTLELQRFETQFVADYAAPDQAFGQWYVGRLLGALREHEGVLLVAMQDDSLCGYGAGLLEEEPEARTHYFYIAELVVSERVRGNGIGAQLIRALEDIARARGLTAIDIGVLSQNSRVHRLYKRLGYRDHAIRLRKKL